VGKGKWEVGQAERGRVIEWVTGGALKGGSGVEGIGS